MTLIVGIKCRDGAVMAADSAATISVALGPTTVCQKCTKLSAVGDLVIGTSGPVGLGQSFRDEIETVLKNHNDKCHWKTRLAAADGLRSAMWKHAKTEWEAAEVVSRTIGPQAAAQTAVSTTLVALPIGDAAQLIQFDFKSSPEVASDDLPFVSIGSGQPLADPFLAFMRKLLWPKDLPRLAHGIFYAVWAVSMAIEFAPVGLALPVQLFTLARKDGSWQARQMDDRELGEHKEAISEVEAAFRTSWEKGILECPEAVCPSPPSPGSK